MDQKASEAAVGHQRGRVDQEGVDAEPVHASDQSTDPTSGHNKMLGVKAKLNPNIT